MATSTAISRFIAAENGESLMEPNFDWESLLAIAGPGVVAVLIALLSAWLGWRTARHSERRKLYAEATKSAVAWVELVYRVRRRGSDDPEVVRALVQRFHEAQEDITFHEAWIGSESEQMAASYELLVSEVKRRTKDDLNAAWESTPRPLPASAVKGDSHPDVSDLTKAFLADVRAHLSLNPFKESQHVKNLIQDSPPVKKDNQP